ncbi:MAG: triose-phosphate isomerase [Proteobacteria bacterium]|nr:triose-phosphate isomerase [Pseudomonadota bacterium]MDA1300321.1 triose-phosphate isomerase [Pseudomonadota bacterium]
MRDSLIAGNWKMNGTRSSAAALARGLAAAVSGSVRCDVVICPPLVFLQEVAECLAGSDVALGAQNVDHRTEGAVTGEVTAGMVKEFGCSYVLVGHSERRSLFHESDEVVAEKALAVLASEMTPIVCVGETLAQRQAGVTSRVIGDQVRAVMAAMTPVAFAGCIIAYEPIWAIGTGETATPEMAQAVHSDIRCMIAEQDAETAQGIRILYGGSVKADNASGLLAQSDIDGALVGGASLKQDEFVAICEAAGV